MIQKLHDAQAPCKRGSDSEISTMPIELKLLLSAILCFHYLHHVTAAQSFGVSLKGIHLDFQKETTVFTRSCNVHERPCAMHHWWSGGTFPGYAKTRVRYYIDSDRLPLELPLGLAHGMSSEDMEDNGSLFPI